MWITNQPTLLHLSTETQQNQKTRHRRHAYRSRRRHLQIAHYRIGQKYTTTIGSRCETLYMKHEKQPWKPPSLRVVSTKSSMHRTSRQRWNRKPNSRRFKFLSDMMAFPRLPDLVRLQRRLQQYTAGGWFTYMYSSPKHFTAPRYTF